MKKILAAGWLLAMLCGTSVQAQNLVANGNFDNLTTGNGTPVTAHDNYVIAGQGVLGGHTISGWSNAGTFAAVYGSGLGDSAAHYPLFTADFPFISGCGSPGQYRECSMILAGSNDGTPGNQGTIVAASSPQGGNYFASDGGFGQGALTQTVTGLMPGQNYTLSFWWAGGVALAGSAPPPLMLNSSWTVTLGNGAIHDVNTTVTTPDYPANGFTPWVQTVINFTASTSSQVLSFMPGGTGVPPMSLLDGVAIMAGTSVVPAVPEPEQWAMLAAGLLLLGGLRLRRRTQQP